MTFMVFRWQTRVSSAGLPRATVERVACVGVAFAQVIEMHRRLNGALTAEVDEMRHERHVLPVTNLLAHIAVAEFVSEKASCQRMSLSRGGFEQRGFEGQDGLAA